MNVYTIVESITYIYFHHFFIILTILVGGVFLYKIISFWKHEISLKNPDLLRNTILKSLLSGIGVYSSFAIILCGLFSGIYEKWPEDCPPQYGGGLLIVAGLIFLIYVLQYAAEFIKTNIEKVKIK